MSTDGVPWTTEASEAVLKGYKRNMSPKAIAAKLHTTEEAVRERLVQLGKPIRQQHNSWTPEEDKLLVDMLMVRRATLDETAKALGRDRVTVSRHAQRFGYQPRQNVRRHPQELVDRVVALRLAGNPVPNIAKELDKSVNVVNQILARMDVRLHTDREWSVEDREKLLDMVNRGESPQEAAKILKRSGRQMITLLKTLYPTERPDAVKTFIYRFNFSLHRLISGKIASSKRRCGENGWAFDLDETWIEQRIKEQGFRCQYSGTPFDLTKPNGDTFSIERIDSNKGYTKDNVVLTTWDVNMMKQDLSLERFVELCRRVTETMAKAQSPLV